MLDEEVSGSKYTAIAVHRGEAGRQKHEGMGFHDGWGTALDQLVDYIKNKHVRRAPEAGSGLSIDTTSSV